MILVIETGHIQGLLCFISHLEPDAENDIAHWLKHYNVNVNEVDCYITLQECIKNKNIEMLELLIKNGFFIDIYTDTLSGLDNALNTAVKCGNIEAIKILLQYCNDNSVKPDSSALLFSAMQVENPSIDMVSYLLNIKAGVAPIKPDNLVSHYLLQILPW
jgi:ankyrin repeat protein